MRHNNLSKVTKYDVRKWLAIALMLISAHTALAYDFIMNGICYKQEYIKPHTRIVVVRPGSIMTDSVVGYGEEPATEVDAKQGGTQNFTDENKTEW